MLAPASSGSTWVARGGGGGGGGGGQGVPLRFCFKVYNRLFMREQYANK